MHGIPRRGGGGVRVRGGVPVRQQAHEDADALLRPQDPRLDLLRLRRGTLPVWHMAQGWPHAGAGGYGFGPIPAAVRRMARAAGRFTRPGANGSVA